MGVNRGSGGVARAWYPSGPRLDGGSSNYTVGVEPVSSSPTGNPNPSKWNWMQSETYKQYFVVKIKYPDCTNYEGVKILVFKAKIDEVLKQGVIDPHFCENTKNMIYPIARFAPTDEGWLDACDFARRKADGFEQKK